MLYIMKDALKARDFSDLFVIESAEDNYEELKFIATLRGMTPVAYAKAHSRFARRIDDYKKAQRHKAWSAKKDQWPKRCVVFHAK
ncbi:MAG: hypothetical protein DCC65_12980 [Planctomycetota bacterium]|nr:MAG: hypothetical protein DCC65_12980 [Planctomycetota bacterium]